MESDDVFAANNSATSAGDLDRKGDVKGWANGAVAIGWVIGLRPSRDEMSFRLG